MTAAMMVARVERLRARARDAGTPDFTPAAEVSFLGAFPSNIAAHDAAGGRRPSVVEPWGDWWLAFGLGADQ